MTFESVVEELSDSLPPILSIPITAVLVLLVLFALFFVPPKWGRSSLKGTRRYKIRKFLEFY